MMLSLPTSGKCGKRPARCHVLLIGALEPRGGHTCELYIRSRGHRRLMKIN